MAYFGKLEGYCEGCGSEYDECVCSPSELDDYLGEAEDDPDFWDLPSPRASDDELEQFI